MGYFSGRVSIVCVGNELSGDDALGPMVYAGIRDTPGIQAIDASTFPEAFVEEILEYHPDGVVLVDAADFGGAAGEIRVIDPSTIESFHFSSHRAPIKLFISSLSEKKIPVTLLCVQAKQTGLGQKMSSKVRCAAEELIKKIIGCH